jgi:hypothetical protein
MIAAAPHCVPSVGFGMPIRATKIVMRIARTKADQNIMLRRPTRSIVAGRAYVPKANIVFITAERSCARKSERPTFLKMTAE